MKINLIAVALAASALCASAQSYYSGSISQPDYFGNRQIHYSNGINGTLHAPDYFGNQTLRYNNGTTIQFSQPDYFGNRQIQVQTMPRHYGW